MISDDERSFTNTGSRCVVVRVYVMEAEVWIRGLGARHEIIEAFAMDDD